MSFALYEHTVQPTQVTLNIAFFTPHNKVVLQYWLPHVTIMSCENLYKSVLLKYRQAIHVIVSTLLSYNHCYLLVVFFSYGLAMS